MNAQRGINARILYVIILGIGGWGALFVLCYAIKTIIEFFL